MPKDIIYKNIPMPKDLTQKAENEAQRLGLNFCAFVRLLLLSYFGDAVFERKEKGDDGNGNKG